MSTEHDMIDQQAHREAVEAAKAEGYAIGVREEADRIHAILSLPEAGGRLTSALALVKAGLDVDAARECLAHLPRTSSLEQRMAADQVSVGAPSLRDNRGDVRQVRSSWSEALEKVGLRQPRSAPPGA